MGRADEMRARAKRYAERAQAMRAEHGSVDAVYLIADRDSEVGGGLMAGALAYRIFIWLLPFSLVLVAGIGIAASTSETPESAAKSLGLQGVVASSVAQAARGSSRWYALLIGIPILLWATRALLKAIVVVHRLVWGDVRRSVPKPTVGATLLFLAMLVGYFVILELARAVGSWTGSVTLRLLATFLGIFAWWLVLSMRLPHRGVPWSALVPGAVVMAIGLELLFSIGTFFIAPRVESSQRAYGALGIAAAILFGLYLISRLVVASAVINVTVWERRTAE
ncbi:MAG TPA: YhjD/YihY/BrkB family envelope integrity protein [Gaiellaceae bacterium]|nr:YhjD/YihY/BrkB family envelope integrity protein [Gaiellaceae bacterium]